MLNHLLSRMPLGRRFNLGAALALVLVVLLCYCLLAYEWSVMRDADEARVHLAALRATLDAMDGVSAELETTNAMLGDEAPLSTPRWSALTRIRVASDDSLAQVLAATNPRRCRRCADDHAKLNELKARLAVARRNVDESGSVRSLASIVDDFVPIVVFETSAVVRAVPRALNCLFIARLSAELRKYAGRLGMHFDSSRAMRRPLTLEEKLAVERTRGRIDQLRAMIEVRMVEYPMLGAQAFASMNKTFFGEGQRDIDAMGALTERLSDTFEDHGSRARSTAEALAQHYQSTLRSIVAFRRAAMDAAQRQVDEKCTDAWLAVIGTAVAEALVLALLGWMALKFRRDVVSPFSQATHAIRAIAAGDLTREVPAWFARGEIRDMFDAISVLKKNSIERSRLEAERARLIHELANMAETDSLTRLLNRRAFEKRTRGLIAHFTNDESDVALIMFDIDHFKRINDTHGHPVGDEALRLVAKLCRRHFGRSDIVARIGGEEFAVVTTVRLPQEGWAAAERMRKDIAATRVPTGDGRYCQMTASFGIAFASSDAEPEVTSLLKQADRMLYQAKAAGRNRVMPEAIRSTSPACARPFDA